jgi:hypothetical protein
MSHYGDTLLVTAPSDNKWVVFEYAKRVKGFEKVHETTGAEVTSGFRMASGSISGDGNTIVYVGHNNRYNQLIVNVYVYTKTADGWENNHTLSSTNTFIVLSGAGGTHLVLELLVSFDGGVVLLGGMVNETGLNMVAHINGKKTGTTITSAFDYLNERSNYGFIDYQNIPILDWSATPTETYTNRPEPHYGTIDALSMSANGHVIIGSPETNKAYLYNNNVTLIHTFEGPVNRFGIRCSIDDNGSIIAIASNTHLYIYDGSTYAEIWTQSYGNNPPESPWNMKISKDGSTIIASNSVGSTSFQSWTTTDTWSTVIGPVDYISSTSKRVSAIDLSMDGSVMIASGFTGGNEGFVNLFSRGTSLSLNEQVITAVLSSSDAIIIGQSIALSGDGKKAIVGAPNNNTALSTRAQVYFIDITSGTSMSVSTIATLTGRQGGRYGRSVSMDYNGRYAMVSGSMSEYTPSNADGSALLIDTSSTSVIKEFPKSSLMYHNTPSYRSSFNGYGMHCKLSSQGDVAAVSGGGYASLFKLP